MRELRLGRRDLTRTGVFALLGRSGPMSRAALAKELHVTPAAVGLVTKALLSMGLVKEVDCGPPTGALQGYLPLVGEVGP